jgi:internalin A
MAHFSDERVVEVIYGEVMTEEELLRVIVRVRRENATSLDLSDKQLVDLPSAIGQLTNLHVLDLRNTGLKKLSESIGQLKNLRELYLYGNQLTNLPETIGQLQNLEVLGLSDNQLMNLPNGLGQLTNLKILFLSGNRLNRLPPALGQLVNLVRLSLSENSLTELPAEIGKLVNLQRLDLLANQLIRLPESIGQLVNLQFLYLAHNQLRALPKSIELLTSLEEIDTVGNPIPIMQRVDAPPLPLPVSVPVKVAPQRITLAQKLNVSKTAWNEAKIIVLGQPHTGKTSLVKRLLHNQFDLNEPTSGVQIEKWSVNFSAGTDKYYLAAGTDCCHVWDFNGQESLHHAHQLFLTARTLYLLVLDNNENEEQNRIKYWLKLIGSAAPAATVLVVGNKSDQAALDLSYDSHYRQKYPNIKGFFAVSCQDATGIADLNRQILQEIITLEHVRVSPPNDWLRVKTKLENLNKGHIIYSEYCQICTDCQISDVPTQQALLQLLHDLGTVLNFQPDQLADDTPIFNTGWIVYGIYKILGDRSLRNDYQGVLPEQMLTRILTPFQYDKKEFTYNLAKHRFILEMMMKLELCCEIINQPSFILPTLLPKEEPAAAQLDLWSDAVQFQYRYPVLPPGIVARLLVRCAAIVAENLYWRDGIILKSLDHQALIKSDQKEKTISLYITGSPATRTDFLKALREELAIIHATLPAFDVDEYVPLPDFPNVIVSYQQLLNSRAEGIDAIVPQGLRQKVSVHELLEIVDGQVAISSCPVNGNGNGANSNGLLPVSSNSNYLPVNPYPTVTDEQLREVQSIALRLVQGDFVDGDVDLLSAHLRAPLADAVQDLLSLQASSSEKSDL